MSEALVSVFLLFLGSLGLAFAVLFCLDLPLLVPLVHFPGEGYKATQLCPNLVFHYFESEQTLVDRDVTHQVHVVLGDQIAF